MLSIVIVVFLAVFLIAALLLSLKDSESQKQAKKTVSRLESIVTVAAPAITDDEGIDLRKQEHLSSIPWLDRLLTRGDIFPRLRLLLYQADLKWTAGALLLFTVACGLSGAMFFYWRTGAFLLSIAIGAGVSSLPLLFVLQKRSSRFAAFERLLPDALGLMVGALRAGHSLTSSIGMAAKESAQPLAGEFRKCFDEQMFGIDTRIAMLNLVKRVPIQPVRILATVVMIQKESGGNLAEVLEKAAHVIRERFQLQRQVRVHTAQGRMTGWVLALLPVGLGFLLYLINSEQFSLLWRRPLGLKLLYGGMISEAIGAMVIRKIVRVRI